MSYAWNRKLRIYVGTLVSQTINQWDYNMLRMVALNSGDERKGTASSPIRLEVSFMRTGEQPFGLLLKVHGTWVKGPVDVSRALPS